jgi:hydroxypyruvate isomerase
MNSGNPLYAPNISWLFPELPFNQRPRAAQLAGFNAIEFGFPSHVDLEALEHAVTELEMEVTLLNQDVPVWDEKNRGYLSDPRRRDEFDRELERALSIAERLSVRKIMLPAGVELVGQKREEQTACILENLERAAPLADAQGCMLTLEVLNHDDNPGYFLNRYAEALDLVREINHPAVRFQLDTYHIQHTAGKVIPAIRAGGDLIGHIQFADWPGRHEPGTGSLDFEEIRKALSDVGYEGHIGLEYVPLAQGAESLGWIPTQQRDLDPSITPIQGSTEGRQI